jgi:hypothetical protein
MPAQIDLCFQRKDYVLPSSPWWSANKIALYQQTKAVLNTGSPEQF